MEFYPYFAIAKDGRSQLDINPYAVASARGFFSNNSAGDISLFEGGPGPDEDGLMEQWSGQGPYDLIFGICHTLGLLLMNLNILAPWKMQH